jgi:hypothetical protein
MQPQAERLRAPFRRFYGGLVHPELTDQLEPLLSDVGSDRPERQVAVEIAADCRTAELLPALRAIALSAQEPYQLRSLAVSGVAQSGDPALAPQLLPLARGEAGDDPEDELRGAALRALWPDEDLPPVLRWAAAYAEDHGANRRALGYAMLRLIEQLARRALQRIDEDETVSALVQLAWGLRRSGERLLPDDVVLDPRARRRLILAALRHLDENSDDVYDVPRLFGAELCCIRTTLAGCTASMRRRRFRSGVRLTSG